MTRVDVHPMDSQTFRVTIDENGSTTSHEVTATEEQIERVGAECETEDLVKASIRFLLDREPKESIMSRFDLDVISRFFPEYESSVHDYL